jgi:basic amino acid/polyamine antiporter, APA family
MATSIIQKNKLGLWTSTSLVAGNMIGSGIFLMPAALAAYGGISIIGWIVSAAGAIILAKIFARLSTLISQKEGGPYAYTRHAFGDFAGFLIAWGYWISVWCANAAIAIAFVSAMSTFFPILETSAIAAVLTGLSAIWFLSWINTRAIGTSGFLQLITTILKISPLIIVAIGGLFFIDTGHFIPFNTSGHSDYEAIMAAAAFTFFAFLGFECATIPSNRVEDAEKTIPKATMLGTFIVSLIYIFSTISVMGILPAAELSTSVTPFADAAEKMWGPQAGYWISAGAAIAAFGALNGWILIQGQISFAIAEDKLFPKIFARENKNGRPAIGIVISSMLVSVLMLMNYTKGLVDQFKFLILLSTVTVLVAYLFSAASYLLIQMNLVISRKRNWLMILVLSITGFLFSLWIIAGTGYETVYWGFILLMSGIPFYVFMKGKQH